MSDCVTIKCNVCGEEWVFHPQTVMYQSPCYCGNNDHGSPIRDWPNNQFGNFTLIERRDVEYVFNAFEEANDEHR